MSSRARSPRKNRQGNPRCDDREAFKIHQTTSGTFRCHQQALAWAMEKNVDLVQMPATSTTCATSSSSEASSRAKRPRSLPSRRARDRFAGARGDAESRLEAVRPDEPRCTRPHLDHHLAYSSGARRSRSSRRSCVACIGARRVRARGSRRHNPYDPGVARAERRIQASRVASGRPRDLPARHGRPGPGFSRQFSTERASPSP